MNFTLPNVPDDLIANATAIKITEQNNQHALQIYNSCLVEIRKQKFPCHVQINKNESTSILNAIITKINDAGYNAIKYTYDDYAYITIDNPFVHDSRLG
jgi:hypothetical protein